MKDYYYILGVEKTASTQEISDAYIKLAIKFHPDNNRGDEFFENRYKDIEEAYRILSDPDLRSNYDNTFVENYLDPVIIKEFTSNKSIVRVNSPFELSWKVLNASQVSLRGLDENLPLSGKKKITLNKRVSPSISYYLDASGPGGKASELIELTVKGEQKSIRYYKKSIVASIMMLISILVISIFINHNARLYYGYHYLKGKKYTYKGDRFLAYPHGKGQAIFGNGDEYTGDFYFGKLSGKGKYIFKSGNVYEGDIVDGKLEGKGKFTHENGDVYEGDFVDGKLTGKGKYKYENGDVYVGDFVNGKRSGKGKHTFDISDINLHRNYYGYSSYLDKFYYEAVRLTIYPVVYEGDFVDGKLTGKGKFTYENGDVYEGDIVDGKLEGKGKFTYENGDVYEGIFINGKIIGKGKLTFSNGDVYEGDFVNGKGSGKGKLILSNGVVYEGDFLENFRTGKGG